MVPRSVRGQVTLLTSTQRPVMGRTGNQWAWFQSLCPFPPSELCDSQPERALRGRSRGLHTHQHGPWGRRGQALGLGTGIKCPPHPRPQQAFAPAQGTSLLTQNHQGYTAGKAVPLREVAGGEGLGEDGMKAHKYFVFDRHGI